MTEPEFSNDINDCGYNMELKGALLWTIQKSESMRKKGYPLSYINTEIIDRLIDCNKTLESSESCLYGLPHLENLFSINGHTSFMRDMNIDWQRYFQLRSKGKVGLDEEGLEEIRGIRELLCLTTDSVAVWQWAYSYLVVMICDTSTQLYPRFDQMVKYNSRKIAIKEEEKVMF